MPYIIFKKDDIDLDVKKLRYRRYENIWDIRYKEDEDQASKTIYIQTPPLKLSLIEEDIHYYYLICQINSNDEKFWDLVQNFDMATIEEMSEDTVSWGFRQETPLTFIEKRFIPTLKMSSINYEYSLHLIVPKSAKFDIFDQEGKKIDMKLLKRDYRLAMLLLLDGVEFKNNYFGLKFCVEQMKVRIPDQTEESEDQPAAKTNKDPRCLLEDSEDNGSTYYKDVSKYSNSPRPDLYERSDDEVDIDEDDFVSQPPQMKGRGLDKEEEDRRREKEERRAEKEKQERQEEEERRREKEERRAEKEKQERQEEEARRRERDERRAEEEKQEQDQSDDDNDDDDDDDDDESDEKARRQERDERRAEKERKERLEEEARRRERDERRAEKEERERLEEEARRHEKEERRAEKERQECLEEEARRRERDERRAEKEERERLKEQEQHLKEDARRQERDERRNEKKEPQASDERQPIEKKTDKSGLSESQRQPKSRSRRRSRSKSRSRRSKSKSRSRRRDRSKSRSRRRDRSKSRSRRRDRSKSRSRSRPSRR